MGQRSPSRRLDQRTINIGEILVGFIVHNDPDGLALASNQLGVHDHEGLRRDLRLVGLLLSFSALNARRLWRRLPKEPEREQILLSIAAGPFGPSSDMDTARDILWLVCGDHRNVAIKTDLRHVRTCLTVGACLLDRQGKGLSFTWASRYRTHPTTMSRYARSPTELTVQE